MRAVLGAAAEGGLLAESEHARGVAMHTAAVSLVRHARECVIYRVVVMGEELGAVQPPGGRHAS